MLKMMRNSIYRSTHMERIIWIFEVEIRTGGDSKEGKRTWSFVIQVNRILFNMKRLMYHFLQGSIEIWASV